MRDERQRGRGHGAGSGIGRATALGFAADRFRVAVTDVDAQRALDIVAEIHAAGGAASSFVADVGDPESVAAMAKETTGALGPPSVRVTCAGWDEMQPFADTAPPFWKRIEDVNLQGVIATTHSFLPCLIGKPARIVNIASDGGRVGSSGETLYAGAKAGVIASRTVAPELTVHQVTVNRVCAGTLPVPRQEPGQTPGGDHPRHPDAPRGRPDDVWHAIRFFTSPGASYITGQVLSVSGALTMNG